MYTLTLTKAERAAFDWVGNRYATGNEVADILSQCIALPEVTWDTSLDELEFLIPEHIAWQIRELSDEEDNLWPCFSPELTCKMNAFLERIV